MKHFYLPFEKRPDFNCSAEAIGQLGEYEKYQLSFHPERPKYLDYLSIFDRVEECLQSDLPGACLIQTHRALLDTANGPLEVMLIGQQSAPTSDFEELQKIMKNNGLARQWNNGMPTPAAYERAIGAIDLAGKEGRLIITMIDTPGADPTEEAEAGGIAWKIGKCMQSLAESPVPTISVIMNRGCSGGAIAMTGCDRVLAMEYSTYLVISPEACSSILFRTRNKASLAAEISQITSREAHAHGIVDDLVPEPEGPAHRFAEAAKRSLKQALGNHAAALAAIPRETIFEHRIEKWRGIGKWDTLSESAVAAMQKQVSRKLKKPDDSPFIKRHSRCRDSSGRRFYDPVLFERLLAENYVCSECGYRYTRLSAQDYIDLVLDRESFREHSETRHIVDLDILAFPGYREKLLEARKSTGMATAFITGDGTVDGRDVVFCATDFGFLGGSFCMSTGEKIWQAAQIAIRRRCPLIVQAAGGGARMHEGCSSMVSIPKAHVALSRIERASLPLVTIVTDPTLGGVAIGFGSRGIRLFEYNAGNIGFSGKRVIEQYTGKKTSRDFQTTRWLREQGFAEHIVRQDELKHRISEIVDDFVKQEPDGGNRSRKA
ncbi:acetyl-CoA carboxylase carboxyl transferase subunit alpha/beta [Prosthecochloris sp. GSB1]|uniref:carboxyl transferase domain-containing protein n=1 Tax=Prosthecochloris sp. GSB1 TaxID=281093 RepID=UPI000B8CAE59|nr:carboxyl transferase domain-containing protein [Prosthecochloris sp. GSB1]ASQ90675.1 acetyl-CoA carboxylase carboxyl transferase subunit alpha/beta [Prosthecochloris sp. GSB1]